MSTGGGKIAGPALIVVGLLMLLGQMGMPAFGVLWPLILLAVGVGMLLKYRQGGEDSGLVFSGSLLIMLTVIFLAAMSGAMDLGRHWPAFPAAVGLAFLVMARVDEKRRDAMVPGWICLGAALVLYFFSLGFFTATVKWLLGLLGTLLKVIIPLGLIGFGGWLLFHERQERSADSAEDFPEKVSPQGPPPPDTGSGPTTGEDSEMTEEPIPDPSEAEEVEVEHEAPGAGLASAEKEVPPAPVEDAEFEEEGASEDEPEGEPDDGEKPEGESEDDDRRDPGSYY